MPVLELPSFRPFAPVVARTRVRTLAWALAAALAPTAACSVAGTVQPASFEDGAVPDGEGTTVGPGPAASSETRPEPNATVANGAGNANAGQANAGTGNDAPTKVVPSRMGPGVAMYWGTGNDQGRDPDLSTLCQDGDVSIIILSFLDTIASYSQNANGAPHMSINDCPVPYDAKNPRLGRCPDLGAKIAACQKTGVQVVASIGGGGAKVGFQSDAEAKVYADLIWNMFLGGAGSVRPFGTAVLDGIDLDVEGGTTTGWAAFVLQLRARMDAAPSKKYLITAAPQCPFRDAWMGPDGESFDGKTLRGTALGLALTSFDHLWVQFYNNYCAFNSPSDFATAWRQWTTLGAGQPKVWVGLPAGKTAAEPAGYVAGPNLAKVVASVQSSPLFGGLMFWDAGYDADTIDAGNKPMRTYAAEALLGLQAAK